MPEGEEEAVVMVARGTRLRRCSSRRRCKRGGKRGRPEGGGAPAMVVVEWNSVWGVVRLAVASPMRQVRKPVGEFF